LAPLPQKIIDIIPELIDLTFIKAVAKDLQPSLYKKFGLGSTDAPARFAKLLAEDPKISARRGRFAVPENEAGKSPTGIV
jgi:hypothetical protein